MSLKSYGVKKKDRQMGVKISEVQSKSGEWKLDSAFYFWAPKWGNGVPIFILQVTTEDQNPSPNFEEQKKN